MKKLSFFILAIFFYVVLFDSSKASANVSDNKYTIISVSDSNVVVNSLTVVKVGIHNNTFSVGDKLSQYYVMGDIKFSTLPWPSPLVWEDSEYIIKEGVQNVTLIFENPVYAKILIQINGEAPPVTSGINGIAESQETQTPSVTKPNTPSMDIDEIAPTLTKSTVKINSKAKYKLEIEDLPEGYTVSFVSSNKKVATVSSKGGVITGKVKGKATVRCIITSPNGDKITLKCSVVVR